MLKQLGTICFSLDCRYIVQTYARPDMVLTHGEGARLYDAHGKEYLDFAAGIAVNSLGEVEAAAYACAIHLIPKLLVTDALMKPCLCV